MSDNHEMEFVAGVGWYEGEYKNGKFDGKGSFTFSDGRRYEGQFKNGEKHGKGTFIFPDGRKYVGEWEKEKEMVKVRSLLMMVSGMLENSRTANGMAGGRSLLQMV